MIRDKMEGRGLPSRMPGVDQALKKIGKVVNHCRMR